MLHQLGGAITRQLVILVGLTRAAVRLGLRPKPAGPAQDCLAVTAMRLLHRFAAAHKSAANTLSQSTSNAVPLPGPAAVRTAVWHMHDVPRNIAAKVQQQCRSARWLTEHRTVPCQRADSAVHNNTSCQQVAHAAQRCLCQQLSCISTKFSTTWFNTTQRQRGARFAQSILGQHGAPLFFCYQGGHLGSSRFRAKIPQRFSNLQ